MGFLVTHTYHIGICTLAVCNINVKVNGILFTERLHSGNLQSLILSPCRAIPVVVVILVSCISNTVKYSCEAFLNGQLCASNSIQLFHIEALAVNAANALSTPSLIIDQDMSFFVTLAGNVSPVGNTGSYIDVKIQRTCITSAQTTNCQSILCRNPSTIDIPEVVILFGYIVYTICRQREAGFKCQFSAIYSADLTNVETFSIKGANFLCIAPCFIIDQNMRLFVTGT